jgi:hypothetical protein
MQDKSFIKMIKRYDFRIFEEKERIFYLSNVNYETLDSVVDDIKNKPLTILMTPISSFQDAYVELTEDYHRSIIDYIKGLNETCLILSSYNLDRLIVETIKGTLSKPRIFMQSGTEVFNGFTYYKDQIMDIEDNELVRLVNKISPSRIILGGCYLDSTEEELRCRDFEEFPFEYSADNGCFVDPIFLMFRDKYKIEIYENLCLRCC